MNTLEQAREQINNIDRQMAALFEARMECARQVLEYKKENGLPIFDPSREAAIIEKNSALITDTALLLYYREFLEMLMGLSKQYQHALLGDE